MMDKVKEGLVWLILISCVLTSAILIGMVAVELHTEYKMKNTQIEEVNNEKKVLTSGTNLL